MNKNIKTMYNLMQLKQNMGYQNLQRTFGPPPDWVGPAPPKGCEIFIGKLPREIYEDELVPLFSKMGKIYEMRIIMDFLGYNRGYAFVTYTNRSDASAAINELNGYELRPRRHLVVVKSVDNCCLFISHIPVTKTKEDVIEELSKHVPNVVNVILYKNFLDRTLNRGFAFAEFTSHQAAAMARRALAWDSMTLWDRKIKVDWADPEPDIDEEQMLKVRVLFVRNFEIATTPDVIQRVFECAINNKVKRVKKFYDFAFIHFYKREHAEQAMAILQDTYVEGSKIEVQWAKPVNRELYRIQKLNRGNAKFSNSTDFTQTLPIYQKYEKQPYASSPMDRGIGSACGGESNSSSDLKLPCYHSAPAPPFFYRRVPAHLESLCNCYAWTSPCYNYKKYFDFTGKEVWICSIELPVVGLPLLQVPQRLGPFRTKACYSIEQAHIEAAETALQNLKVLEVNLMEQSKTTMYSQASSSVLFP